MICPNCKTKLSCGCQQRRATNGNTVCTSCYAAYEAGLKNSANNPNQINITATTANLNKKP